MRRYEVPLNARTKVLHISKQHLDCHTMYAGGDSGYAAADFGLEAYADMLMQDAGLRL